MISIDPAALSDDQLAALSLLDPQAAQDEIERRGAYDGFTTAFTKLAQAGLDLAHILEAHRQTTATKAVLETGIIEIIKATLATARNQEIEYTRPVLFGE